MAPPNLADPDFEPTDEQLAELCRRAFAGVEQAHQKALDALREGIAREGEAARKRWAARKP